MASDCIMSRELRLALVLGLVPLCCGIGILLLWMATRWEALMMLGLLTICVGVILVLAGAIYLRAAPGRDPRRRRAAKWVLWANFPAAAFALWAVLDVMSSCTITIHNESGFALEALEVSGAGVLQQQLGSLPTGRSLTVRVRPPYETSLDLYWDSEGRPQRLPLDVYVGAGSEAHVEVTVPDQGPPEVDRFLQALGWFQSAPR